MDVAARQSPRLLRRRRPRDRDRRARRSRSFGAPIYVRHEVVHNKFVVDDLQRQGRDLRRRPRRGPGRQRPSCSRAHGVSRAVRAEAEARGLRVFDATCPLVTKVHVEVAKMREQGREIVMIGHAGHPEVEGTMGQCDGGIHLVESVGRRRAPRRSRDPAPLAYVTQTTLSVDDAAGDRRRAEARASRRSSARRRTTSATRRRTARTRSSCMTPRRRRRDRRRQPQQLELEPPARSRRATAACPRTWSIAPTSSTRRGSTGKRRVGVTAGASAPEVLVQRGARAAAGAGRGVACASSTGVVEHVVFPMPEGPDAAPPPRTAAAKSRPLRGRG